MTETEPAGSDGPEVEVWNHLYSGLDLATMELDVLSPDDRRLVQTLGKQIADARTRITLPTEGQDWSQLYESLLGNPWVRHATEIEIGYAGLDRLTGALERFLWLEPALTSYAIPERAARYFSEVVETYLFGFHAGCIAMCGAALEQVLRELVVSEGIYTPGRLRREQPTGLTLLLEAKRKTLVHSSFDSADRVLRHRNKVMHREIFDDRIIKNISLQCIGDLGHVLVELGER